MVLRREHVRRDPSTAGVLSHLRRSSWTHLSRSQASTLLPSGIRGHENTLLKDATKDLPSSGRKIGTPSPRSASLSTSSPCRSTRAVLSHFPVASVDRGGLDGPLSRGQTREEVRLP